MPGSVTFTPVKVVFPVFATVIEYLITTPTESYGPIEVTDLATFSAGAQPGWMMIVWA
jgi:hypothetical protein